MLSPINSPIVLLAQFLNICLNIILQSMLISSKIYVTLRNIYFYYTFFISPMLSTFLAPK
jgi:hypothetical protein